MMWTHLFSDTKDITIPNETLIELANDFVDERVGPIIDVKERKVHNVPSNDIYWISMYLQSTDYLKNGEFSDIESASGIADSRDEATVIAFGEAFERYSSRMFDRDQFVSGEFSNMNDNAISPLQFNKFSQKQLLSRNVTESDILEEEYMWTTVIDLNEGREWLIPAQLVFIDSWPSEQLIRNPITTGLAAGSSLSGAIYRATCEIIERDCFIVGYLNELEFPRIDTKSLENKLNNKWVKKLSDQNKRIHVLYITIDQPLHVILCIVENDDRAPAISLGMGSDVSIETAIQDALSEAYISTQWRTYDDLNVPDRISSIEARSRYWASNNRVGELDFWTENCNTISMHSLESINRLNALEEIKSYIQNNNYNFFIKDITSEDIAGSGFKTVRVIIPELHPMNLLEEYRYLGGDRLYNAPVDAGLRKNSRAEEEMNQIPHPFL